MNPKVRFATAADMDAVWHLIEELAIYEKARPELTIEPQQLKHDFLSKKFSCMVAEHEAQIIGMTLFYPRYSTWKGPTIHLEDFIVKGAFRGKGVGKLLFDAFLIEALKSNPGRIEWTVLEWNEPAIQFYNKLNANLDPTWMLAQLSFDAAEAYLSNK
jgi:GNAT superfamily N-acetyltransferase